MISTPLSEEHWLEEHPGYHQQITGEEAELRLRKNGGHCYLTRFNKDLKCYILSVYEKQGSSAIMRHFKILIVNGKRKKIDGLNREFDDVISLLEYYEQHRVDPALRSIGKAYTESTYKQHFQQGELERQRVIRRRRRFRCIIQ